MTHSYRDESNVAKALRTGIVEQRPVGRRNRRLRTATVEFRTKPGRIGFSWEKDWCKWAGYRNAKEAQAAADNLSRKYTFNEYRVAP